MNSFFSSQTAPAEPEKFRIVAAFDSTGHRVWVMQGRAPSEFLAAMVTQDIVFPSDEQVSRAVCRKVGKVGTRYVSGEWHAVYKVI